MIRGTLHTADVCCAAYLAGGAILLAAFGGTAHLPRATVYLAATAAIVWLVPRARPDTSPAQRVALAIYPVLLVAVAWGELRLLIPLPWTGVYWATDLAVRADAALFGGHPTAMVLALHHRWLDELMAIVYLTYYVFLAVPAILLGLGRPAPARAAAAVIALTYSVNFALFVVLPIESPPQILDRYPDLLPARFGGWLAADALRELQSRESVIGAAFPSSHVAGSVACALAAWRWAPALGRVLLPMSGGVAFATVYLGYHHAIDPLAGIVWGCAAWLLACAWMRSRGELPREST